MRNKTDTDHYFDVLFDYVRKLIDIPKSDQELCRLFFKPVKVKKNTILEKAGQIHHYHNFIVSGYMRNYHINDRGEEVVTDINDGPRFFTSYYHFMNRTPSNENLHCITDCELLRITRDDVDKSGKLGKTQMTYSLLILEESLERSKQRAIDLSILTAEERYQKLLRDQPKVIQHVPLTYISSYLGIVPGSLSRIRNKLGN